MRVCEKVLGSVPYLDCILSQVWGSSTYDYPYIHIARPESTFQTEWETLSDSASRKRLFRAPATSKARRLVRHIPLLYSPVHELRLLTRHPQVLITYHDQKRNPNFWIQPKHPQDAGFLFFGGAPSRPVPLTPFLTDFASAGASTAIFPSFDCTCGFQHVTALSKQPAIQYMTNV